jgi:hypothetical protein
MLFNSYSLVQNFIRGRLGGAERNPTDYQDVGLRKASTQPTIFFA